MAALEKSQSNEAAACVIEEASHQCPQVLHPHLDRLFEARYAAGVRNSWPWHGSGIRHLDFLLRRLRQGGREEALKAWACLLATRAPEVLRVVLEQAPAIHARFARRGVSLERWLGYDLGNAGLALEDDQPRWLHGDEGWHLAFPDDYFTEDPSRWWLA